MSENGLSLKQGLGLACMVGLAAIGVVMAALLPGWVVDDLREAAGPFWTWEELVKEQPGCQVKLKGRILASVAPSHAGFAAYHKLESVSDSDGKTSWRTVLEDEPELLMELAADGPSVKVLSKYEFVDPFEHEFGGYRYDFIPLEREVWLLGTLCDFKDVPMETERVNELAKAGPAQRLPVIRAKFIACSTVDEYLSSIRGDRALLIIPGLVVLLVAVLMIWSSLKRWTR